jgi:hypothetical protein
MQFETPVQYKPYEKPLGERRGVLIMSTFMIDHVFGEPGRTWQNLWPMATFAIYAVSVILLFTLTAAMYFE